VLRRLHGVGRCLGVLEGRLVIREIQINEGVVFVYRCHDVVVQIRSVEVPVILGRMDDHSRSVFRNRLQSTVGSVL